MKFRLTITLALALTAIIAVSSCTKKYTCHCTIKYSQYPGLPDSTFQEYDITDSKSSAKSKCEANSATYDNNGIHTVENCYLY